MGYVQSSGGFTINVTGALSGTAGEVAYFDSVNSVTSSPNFTWDGTTLGVTGVVTASTAFGAGNGSVGTPSISFVNASTTGFYRTGSDNFAVACGGAAVGSFTTTSITFKGLNSAPFFIKGAVADSTGLSLYVDGSANTNIISTINSDLKIGTNSGTIMTIGADTTITISTSTGISVGASATTNNILAMRRDQNGLTRALFQNFNAGASARFLMTLGTDAGDFNIQAGSTASGGQVFIVAEAGYTGGMIYGTEGTGALSFKTSNTTAISIDGTSQAITLGTPATTTIKHALNALLAATASAGGSSLPATPEGFWVVTINGTDRKIPYYPT